VRITFVNTMNFSDPSFDAGLIEQTEAVSSALVTIFNKVAVELHARELQRQACDKAASKCLEVAYDVIKIVYPARQGAPFTPISMVNESWEPEPPMVPCSVERWCGGFIGSQVL
jgi:hypothetical protein